MGNAYFEFKQFTVHQDLAAMKVGTDGILLGAWAQIPRDAVNVLDIGTGTGLIALMSAQRSSAKVIAIDCDDDAFAQAQGNVTRSPWQDRITVLHTPVQDLDPHIIFEAIVCNPPFYENASGMADSSRSRARHGVTLSYRDLAESVARLLKKNGVFSTILPSHHASEFTHLAQERGLHLSRRCYVYPKPGVDCKRHLMEFRTTESVPAVSDLTVETEVRHTYAPAYRILTADFYLNH